ncbi:MAG: glycosyltransferase family 39 protein [Candidatus Sumerlaeaceae bacterium]|nr:glycosyltransferase family 39 protein [Candidatus Sumerlaeaceae bacterium]
MTEAAASRPGSWLARRHKHAFWAILLLAIGLRIFIAAHIKAVWFDQILLLQQAQLLLEGKWTYANYNEYNFFTLHGGGLSSYNHPLYPVITAVTAMALRNLQWSGILVSFAANTIMLLLVYRIGRSLLGRNWSLCLLAACSLAPAFAELSVNCFAESLYMMWVVLCGWCVLQACRGKRPWAAALGAGAAMGCAYLTKPEAFALAPVFALGLVVGTGLGRRRRWNVGLGLAVVFGCTTLVTALPYPLYFKVQTGQWMPPQKFLYNFLLAERLETMRVDRAYWELNDTDTDTVLSERVSKETVASAAQGKYAHLAARSLGNLNTIFSRLIPLGPFSLAVAGILTVWAFLAIRGWKRRLLLQGYLVLLVLAQVLPMTIFNPIDRLVTQLPTAMSLAGLMMLRNIGRSSAWLRVKTPADVPAGLLTIITATCVGMWFILLPPELKFIRSQENLKIIGEWLKPQVREDTVVMSRNPTVPFYAHTRHIILPAELDPERVYNYGVHKGAEFVVIVDTSKDDSKDILLPEPYFQLYKQFDQPKDKRSVRIYRFVKQTEQKPSA